MNLDLSAPDARQACADALFALVGSQQAALERVLAARNALHDAKADLAATEARVVLAGACDGKNAETRAAQLWDATAAERVAVHAHEEDARAAETLLEGIRVEAAAWRSVVRLLTSEKE